MIDIGFGSTPGGADMAQIANYFYLFIILAVALALTWFAYSIEEMVFVFVVGRKEDKV